MKRIIAIVVACLAMSSCGLLSMLLNVPTQDYDGNSGLGGLMGIAPNPRNLTPSEDPGTGLYGVLSNLGTWVIPPSYDYIGDYDTDTGLAVARMKGGRCGAIDVYGNTVIEFNFESTYQVRDAISSISRGRYTGIELWPMEDRGTELYGYLDHYGHWHIPPQYLYARDFNDAGYAVVQFGEEQWGAIDRSNRVIIQPNFRSQYNALDALNSLIRR